MEEQKLFLLGGHDLEMYTIAEMLKENHLLYKDNSLQWHNACLSQYKKEIQLYGNHPSLLIFGIELQEDMPLPCNYIRIDHHNTYTSLPSALEQVAELLHLPLNRYQSLVAANDKGYIAGMLAIKATSEEIEQIRYEDRRAQGVTEVDEELAEKAIQENKEQIGDIIIIRSFSSRFSPICDRLYPCEKLLIYTNQELMYYGTNVCSLKNLFETEIKKGSIFYGGGDSGYLGTKTGAFTSRELEIMINQITQFCL